jgi:hypothetical protein
LEELDQEFEPGSRGLSSERSLTRGLFHFGDVEGSYYFLNNPRDQLGDNPILPTPESFINMATGGLPSINPTDAHMQAWTAEACFMCHPSHASGIAVIVSRMMQLHGTRVSLREFHY